ncbi:UDP-N-acetylglucosamine--N-acetylmuramyl-(pentapeptide) pyrophosphoryl-undecaprenol N-acetylglucosamine transferase [Candidatus Nomurabacteria bacterium]|nr:UDP-N-acetylglucosamine--N-acetylmuramyl-(pentapeptide) pyrophosphoryl-undecaprenol N-acetylglucosamine transferase [Candidatus Nomurabacteria bacterium]
MKILLTGGGTGGHFYPLIAIAEELNVIAQKEKILDLKLYYMSDSPYDKQMLFNNRVTYVAVPAGKLRTYSSIRNFFDMITACLGAIVGLLKLFTIYPDVVISKGGYASFPAVFGAKVLRIPVIVHESDSHPGRLNLWTAKFARHIAVSWPEAVEYLPKEKTVLTGQPVRKSIQHGASDGAYEFFNFSKNKKTILILGGSQGAEIINKIILDALPLLIEKYQIIHQTGVKNFEDVNLRSNFILEKNPLKSSYKAIAYLNDVTTKMAAGVADVVLSRAGSTIFEIASWGIPSIIVPITNSNGDHQRKNAYNYARTGAGEVVEEINFKPHVITALIDKLIKDPKLLTQMKEHAIAFTKLDAAYVIADEAIKIALEHE